MNASFSTGSSSSSVLKTRARFFKLATPENPFQFADGSVLTDAQLAYETYGQLNPEKDNAILVFHALSGSQHASGYTDDVPGVGERWTADCRVGWWNSYIGPGKALDTNRYFVICANYLGSCYGSSGPCSINPETGQPYGGDFPAVRSTDIVRSQVALLDYLGIGQLRAVVGPSVGGLLAVNLASMYPKRVRIVIHISSGSRTTVLSRLTLLEQVIAVENDPNFKAGHYYGGPLPEYGLALARMISHKTFVHLDTIENRARNEVLPVEVQFSSHRVTHNVESYMLHQGRKFVRRFDANSYLRVIGMWLNFDPLNDANVSNYENLFERSGVANHHYLVFSVDSDFCFYPEEQEEIVRQLDASGVSHMHISVHSKKGHDSFLLEPELFTPHIVYTLDGRFAAEADHDDDFVE